MTDPRTVPSFTTRLWSEEVGLAEAGEVPRFEVGYRFSNGRERAMAQYDAPVFPLATAGSTGQAQRSAAVASVA